MRNRVWGCDLQPREKSTQYHQIEEKCLFFLFTSNEFNWTFGCSSGCTWACFYIITSVALNSENTISCNYNEAPLQRKNYKYKPHCTLESSYTLGCTTIHPCCIVKHSIWGREDTPAPQCLVCGIIVQVSCTITYHYWFLHWSLWLRSAVRMWVDTSWGKWPLIRITRTTVIHSSLCREWILLVHQFYHN